MKNIFIALLFLLTVKGFGQFEVPLITTNAPNQYYLKDTNNELLPYVGTWEGTLNNKKYTFVFQKFTKEKVYLPDGIKYHYEDVIKGNFKVTDLATDNVLYSSLNGTSFNDCRLTGLVKPFGGTFNFYFIDTDANCQNVLNFTLNKVSGQPNQLKYCNFEYNESWRFDFPGCTNRENIPVFLPQEDLILTKL